LQIIKPFREITSNDINDTLDVNLKAPLLLSQVLLSELKKNNGKIINISSIHSKLTKINFLAYSVSKSAIDGFTRALALEIGQDVGVIGIAPAAIKTKMLEKSFSGYHQKFKNLKNFHPTKTIGTPEEIADLINYIMHSKGKFLNGSIINIDGGISHKLHDPK
jgi:NAD(P)-dependent dehydrogenase (short-subunit alcohol dehydrogenase family)